MQVKICFLIFIILLMSCESNTKKIKKIKVIPITREEKHFVMKNDPDNYELACRYIENFPQSFDSVLMTTKQWFQSKDPCVCGLIDTVTYYYLKTKDIKYLYCLDSICMYSDGYIATAAEFQMKLLFNNKDELFLSYITENNSRSMIFLFLCYYIDELKNNNKWKNKNLKEQLERDMSFIKSSEKRDKIVENINNYYLVFKAEGYDL